MGALDAIGLALKDHGGSLGVLSGAWCCCWLGRWQLWPGVLYTSFVCGTSCEPSRKKTRLGSLSRAVCGAVLGSGIGGAESGGVHGDRTVS